MYSSGCTHYMIYDNNYCHALVTTKSQVVAIEQCHYNTVMDSVFTGFSKVGQ